MSTRARIFAFCPYDGTRLRDRTVERRRRRACPACGFVDYRNPRPCVAILVVRRGRVLLARRGVPPRAGLWDVPGGFVEAGETAEDAVRREAREETGLQVRVVAMLGSLPDVYGSRRVATLNLCYVVEARGGIPAPASDVTELRWVAVGRPGVRLAFAHQRAMLDLLRQRLRRAR